MSIKRYDIHAMASANVDIWTEQEESNAGEWVKADDVAKLEKANAALTDKLSDYQQDMAVLAGENEVLVKRWAKMKDLFQISVDLYTDDDDIDVSMAQQAIDEMNKLEKA